MLGLLALKMCVCVREDEYAAMAVDRSFPASYVLRQARVTRGVDLACANAVANLEAGFGIDVRTSVTPPLFNRRR